MFQMKIKVYEKSIFETVKTIYLSIYLPVHLSIYLSIYPSIYLSLYLSIYLYAYTCTINILVLQMNIIEQNRKTLSF